MHFNIASNAYCHYLKGNKKEYHRCDQEIEEERKHISGTERNLPE